MLGRSSFWTLMLAIVGLVPFLAGGTSAAPSQAPSPPTKPAQPTSLSAGGAVDSVALHNEWARRFNERQKAIRDSLAAEAENWHYEHQDMTIEEQISDLNRRILAEPRNAELYNNLGVIYAERQDWLLARDAFISAVQANPVEADYHRNLALVLGHVDDPEMAVSEFQAYQKLDPKGGPDAWRLMGEAWRQAGKPDRARDAFKTAMSKLPPEKGAERMRVALALGQLEEDRDEQGAARSALEKHLPEARRLIAAGAGEADTAAAALAAEPARVLVGRLLAGYITDANVLMESDMPADAANLYAKAFDLAPERDDVLVGIVSAYLAAGQQGKAREVTRRATEKYPRAEGVWIAAGRVAEDIGDVPGAISAYEKVMELSPGRQDLKLRLGNLYLRNNDVTNARRLLADAVSDPGTPPESLYNYAVSLIKEQKYSLAVGPLRRAVRASPEMGQAWAALGMCLRQTEQYGEAATAYRRAIALGPDSRLSFNLGLSLARSGQTEAAITAYREAIALDPKFKEAHYNLGRVFMDAGRHEEAVPALEQALALEPDSYQTNFALGLCHYRLGRYADAVDAYNRALGAKETSDALQNMGLAFDKLGRKEDAARCYAEAKKLKAAKK